MRGLNNSATSDHLTSRLRLGRRAPVRWRVFHRYLAVACLTTAAACEIEIQAPPESGFIAVIMNGGGATLNPDDRYVLRIREATGLFPVDNRFLVTPFDTVIGVYPMSAYLVSLDSVPPSCTSRAGFAQQATISAPGNTSITRFRVECNAPLLVSVWADGFDVDDSFVWTVAGPDYQQSGLIGPRDTTRLEVIRAGEYTVELAHVAPHCAIISNGWNKQQVMVIPPAVAMASFRIRCADPAQQPQILHLASSVTQGVSAFYAELFEPDRDIGRYAWNVTDCHGNIVGTAAGRFLDRLEWDRTGGMDTVRIAGALELQSELSGLRQVCTALRFEDLGGNTTAWIEERHGNETGLPPQISEFNVVVAGGQLRTTLRASDPDGDLAGAFLTLYYEDGTRGDRDGRPDVAYYNVAGFLPPFDIPVIDASKVNLQRLISITADVIDRSGNRSRAVDTNFAQ